MIRWYTRPADAGQVVTREYAYGGDGTAGRAPNGYRVTLTSRAMPERTVRASTSRVMRISPPKENRK